MIINQYRNKENMWIYKPELPCTLSSTVVRKSVRGSVCFTQIVLYGHHAKRSNQLLAFIDNDRTCSPIIIRIDCTLHHFHGFRINYQGLASNLLSKFQSSKQHSFFHWCNANGTCIAITTFCNKIAMESHMSTKRFFLRIREEECNNLQFQNSSWKQCW